MKTKQVVKCITCKNAYLMRNGANPIISECYDNRKVANSPRRCDKYTELKSKPIIHQMKFLK
ncbi:MAG: hypothetical protein ACRCZY_04950 [Phocaeicola sp.]